MKEHEYFQKIEIFRINNLPYVKSDKPIEDEDVVIDKRDLCWGIADTITNTHIGIRDFSSVLGAYVCEGVPKEFVQRLELQTM